MLSRYESDQTKLYFRQAEVSMSERALSIMESEKHQSKFYSKNHIQLTV